ncbi:DUF6538 domain-containing protein [Motiliproteus sp. MSK22-1]|uniref:DUF6538 domain-containing protein n=1 Tax=Motiliproteus sp. MSK22-1 TaxID=1897630 RepID=UPI0018E94B5C|nr:DUF6538 domain-containing protein [Motiliproteus sp. MSK22-1]
MLQKLVRNRKSYLLLRGRTYYFRYSIPLEARRLCPLLPIEVKRSLRTDSLSEALALISQKLQLIKLLQRCVDPKLLPRLLTRLLDFSEEFEDWVVAKVSKLQERPQAVSEPSSVVRSLPKPTTPHLSVAWGKFVKWKDWNPKRTKDNQRLFENLLFFIGDRPVGDISKKMLRRALEAVAKLPQRNKRPYKGLSLAELVKFRVPERNRVASKYVKEHLKICQSLFSRYLVQEVDILKESPTLGLRLEYEDQRFASLTDTEVLIALERSKRKPEWFKWFLKLAVYSGARRSDIARLR